jgi:hypothetical protein
MLLPCYAHREGKTGEEVLHQQVKKYLEFNHVDDNGNTIYQELPPPPTLLVHTQAAVVARLHVTSVCDRQICAVCNIPKPKVLVQTLPIGDIPNLGVLMADEESLTIFKHQDQAYVLQPAGCVLQSPGCGWTANVCKGCYAALKKGKIPVESLRCFDAGSIPQSLDPATQLKPLRMMEEKLLAMYNVCRLV